MSEYLRTIDARQDETEIRRLIRAHLGKAASSSTGADVAEQVAKTLQRVRSGGDIALASLSKQFDYSEYTPEMIRVSEAEIDAAYEQVSPELLASLRRAIANVRAYHERELPHGWSAELDGVTLGSRITPLASAGIYVPAGQAPLPSTVYMCAVPAQVAGVPRLALCSPPRRDGTMDALTLVAARECGVAEVYRLGGAQAIAALAYGTETVTPVDKIVGPGNPWVVEAKRQVFGVVGIESLPGPSESAMIADDSADPEVVAADLLSQAEHTGDNTVVLLTPSERLAEAVRAALPAQVAALGRAELIGKSLEQQGAIVLVRDLTQAAALVSELAPEHLELAVADPEALAEQIPNAGCIFLGHLAAVPLGDYAAGPSHVLPTGGTARFSSPLSVQDFVKRTSLVQVSPEGLQRLAPDVIALAEAEGLTAHAAAIKRRLL
ncbi:MAG TPA: histidinol dehydrogenase [Armatimonadota bacterium]|jgi:histidinol dehydrogenase